MDGCHEGIVLCRGLRSHAEMVGRETYEIGAVADENMMIAGQVFFQVVSGTLPQLTQHKVGIGIFYANAFYAVEHLTESGDLRKVRTTDEFVVLKQEFTSLNGQRGHAPRAQVTSQLISQFLRCDDKA